MVDCAFLPTTALIPRKHSSEPNRLHTLLCPLPLRLTQKSPVTTTYLVQRVTGSTNKVIWISHRQKSRRTDQLTPGTPLHATR